jgi:hypothetical protein
MGDFAGTLEEIGGSPARGSTDGFVVKLSAGLGVLWLRAIGGTAEDHASALALDGNDDVFVTGTFSDSVDFGDNKPLITPASEVFLAKYAGENGALVWARVLGSPGPTQATSVFVDAQGDVLVSGSFAGSADFGDAVRTSAGGRDIFVAKYAGRDGSPLGSQAMGGAGDEVASALTLDARGSVVLAGSFEGTASFQGLALTSRGASDAFLLNRNR